MTSLACQSNSGPHSNQITSPARPQLLAPARAFIYHAAISLSAQDEKLFSIDTPNSSDSRAPSTSRESGDVPNVIFARSRARFSEETCSRSRERSVLDEIPTINGAIRLISSATVSSFREMILLSFLVINIVLRKKEKKIARILKMLFCTRWTHRRVE